MAGSYAELGTSWRAPPGGMFSGDLLRLMSIQTRNQENRNPKTVGKGCQGGDEQGETSRNQIRIDRTRTTINEY